MQNIKKVTLKDVAEATDMSISAVSLVLSNKPNRISQDKQAIIWKEAQKMGYVPNISSNTFHNNRKIIGAICPDYRNFMYSALLTVLNSMCESRGWQMVSLCSDDDISNDISSLKLLSSIGADAIAFIPSNAADSNTLITYTEMLKDYPGVVIFIEKFNQYVSTYSALGTNQKKGGYIAIKHLLSLGHKKIACVFGGDNNVGASGWYKGACAAFNECNSDLNNLSLYFGDMTPMTGYELADKIINDKNTAVFCHDSGLAFGIQKRILELGLKIPNDLSIISSNENYFSGCTGAPFTTLSFNGDRLGYLVAEKIFTELNNPEIEKSITLIDPTLIIGQSTGKPSEN